MKIYRLSYYTHNIYNLYIPIHVQNKYDISNQ